MNFQISFRSAEHVAFSQKVDDRQVPPELALVYVLVDTTALVELLLLLNIEIQLIL